jgi:hypothetical protein
MCRQRAKYLVSCGRDLPREASPPALLQLSFCNPPPHRRLLLSLNFSFFFFTPLLLVQAPLVGASVLHGLYGRAKAARGKNSRHLPVADTDTLNPLDQVRETAYLSLYRRTLASEP